MYRTAEMEEDAPPVSSLGDYADGNESMGSLYPDTR